MNLSIPYFIEVLIFYERQADIFAAKLLLDDSIFKECEGLSLEIIIGFFKAYGV